MAYKDTDFSGNLLNPVRVTRYASDPNFFNKFKTELEKAIKRFNVPASIEMSEFKCGFLTKVPMIVITHPVQKKKYSRIGIYLNETALYFPLIGLSPDEFQKRYNALTPAKTNTMRIAQKTIFKPNTLKLQQEELWQTQIADCINSLFGR